MIGLVAHDALHEQVIRVSATSRASDVERGGRGAIWAVFGEADNAGGDGFLGLVSAQQVSRNPRRTFSELLPPETQEPVGASASLAEAMRRLRGGEIEALPVLDEEFRFQGVITMTSLVNALLRRERELLKKSRDYRKNVQDDKRRRYESVRRLEQVNQAFKKLLQLMTRPSGYDLFQRGIEALAVVLQASYSAVNLLDESGQFKETIFAGLPPGSAQDSGNFREQRWLLLERVVRENAVLCITDVPQYLRKSNLPITRPVFMHFLGMPISRDGHVYGCVYFCDKSTGEPFTDDDEVLATSFAQALGLVLSQARESARRKRAERERDILSRLALQLAGADRLEKVGVIVRQVCEEFWSWDTFAISVRRSGHTRFRVLLRVDKPPRQGDPVMGTRPPGETLITSGEYQLLRRSTDEQLLAGHPVLISNKEDPRTSATETPAGRRHACIMSVPVRVENEVVGIVSVQAFKASVWDEGDLSLFQRIGDTVGPALKRCHAETRGSVLAALAMQLNTVTTSKEAAHFIVAAADELVGWDACSIYMYSPEQKIGRNVLYMDVVNGSRQEVDAKEIYSGLGVIAQRAVQAGPQLILRDSPAFSPEEMSPFGDTQRPSLSLMFVPMRTRGQVTGIISVQSYLSQAYDERDLEVLAVLAEYCGGAMERTRVEEELRQSESKRLANA